MRRLLNTLFITRQDSYLHRARETVVVKQDRQKVAQFPIHNIEQINCYGQVSVSPFLMGLCAERDVGLSFFTEYGRFMCRVTGKPVGNVLLRREQFRRADDADSCTGMSRLFVSAKIANARMVLQRELRNQGGNPDLEGAVTHLAASIRHARHGRNVDQIRGIEGDAAARYFSVFGHMLKNDDFRFAGRMKYPATDPVNALLSFAYSMITSECVSALAGVGLDPYVGFLHKDRPGRCSLALDMVEEFRASWADRLVLTMLNRRELSVSDFVTEGSGAVRMTDDARSSFLESYQKRKQKEIMHPYMQERIPMGLLPYCQAMLMARHIRGDMEHYTPYLYK